MCTVTVSFKVDGGTIESGGSYIAWQEFDDHAQDEPGPEDVQSLQQKHQPIEEVEAKEGGVEGERVNPRRMYDPGIEDKGRTESSQSHLQSQSKAH